MGTPIRVAKENTFLRERCARREIAEAMNAAPRLPILLFFISFVFLAACGGGGSSSNNPPPIDAVPAITSLNPNSVAAGASAFTLNVNGQNFASDATIEWNGELIATTYVSGTQLQAQINALEVAAPGTATVGVVNPGQGSSGSAEFTINLASNPVPTLTLVSPTVVDPSSSVPLLTVTGTNFVPASTIQWNGASVSTTYLSTTQLQTQIPSSDLSSAGMVLVTVFNPGPGGGTSQELALSVAPETLVVSQLANNLVWDATHQLIYLSVPSLASANGNSVVALNPTTGAIQSVQFAGSEPDMLAISDDDQYVYVGLDGSSSVERFTLPSLTPDLSYSLGAFSIFGPTFAVDLQVAPGLPNTTAVSRGGFNVSPYALGGMVIYDGATARSTLADVSGPLYDSLQWVSDSSIFANNSEVATFDLYALAVNGSGVTQSADYLNVFPGFGTTIHYDSGTTLLYGDDGSVANPITGQQVGSFIASGLMIPDSTLNTAFFLGQTQNQVGTQDFMIEMFNLTTFVPLAEIPVANVHGNPQHLIRWGATGLAFNDDAGFVYVIANPFPANSTQVALTSRFLTTVRNTRWAPRIVRASRVAPISSMRHAANAEMRPTEPAVNNPLPAISSLSPNAVSAGTNSFTLTVIGTNFVSLSTIDWNGGPLPTELLSSTELQAQVTLGLVDSSGTAAITVVTPSPGGGTSNSLTFLIASQTGNVVPVISSLYPDSIAAGSAGLTFSVNAGNVSASSVVNWNGDPLPTQLNGALLQAQVSAAQIANPGYANVTVFNPGANGGTSDAALFQVLYQPTIVNQVTNDMVWDSFNQIFYISIPSTASRNANDICSLNPTTGQISGCQTVGNNPDRLAISDDGQFLYVGEDANNTVQRLLLPSLTPDISYSIAPYYALDLQVAPGLPHTTAVSKGLLNEDPAAAGGVTIYDDATPRPTSVAGWGSPGGKTYDSLQWGADATVLYAADTENTSFDFYTLNVNSSGVTLNQDYPSVFWNPGQIQFDKTNELVYSNDGFHVVDPSTGLPVGIFDIGAGWPMAPDSTLNTVFVLSHYAWQENSNLTLNLFDPTHYVRVSQIPFSTIQSGLGKIGRFVRWGTSGIALQDPTGNIYLISGSFVTANSEAQVRSESSHRAP